MRLAVLVPCILLCTLVAACSRPSSGSKQTSVCDIRAHPELFEGRSVRLHAQYVTDGIHGAAIVDPSCGKALAVDSAGKDVNWAPVDRVVDGVGYQGSVGKTIEADFVGVFSGKVGHGVLYVTGVSNVTYSMKGPEAK
ncbi:hypothetical protein EC912_102526 [Luteibacter rhizovicinus]|uniref:Lipoprotein n=1 Tax=Luteibacter rhizovicinus TaxID=242606 RepID=A0A4R3YUT4_9GAMM|nr:hypothetical protein [Luteibacter rhizovicinus]TCV96176.1 hypothetical protein EC912_102526 [Luteibacter rhizovicinus]